MDSEKKLSKTSILPAKKSKVFEKNTEEPVASQLWVPPSFKTKTKVSSHEKARIFKSNKPSFIPKVSNAPESSQETPTPFESENSVFTSVPLSVPQQSLSSKSPALLIFLLSLVILAATCLTAWLAYDQGYLAAQNHISQLRLELPTAIPLEFEKAIDSAFAAYSDGNASEATTQLEMVYRKNQTIPSTCYLLALTAIQSGDLKLALQKVDESIAKGEKVSDSFALKAAIEMEMGGRGGLGDPKVVAESLLRSAMAADISNPRPYIELASLLRFQGRNEEARKLFEGASLRLNPVEGHALVNASLALLDLQQTPDDKLPSGLNPDKDTQSLISAAYVAMRQNDIPTVKSLLATGREKLSVPLYNYLINDPAMKTFSKNPQLSGLF
jgi:tetratricopeptide (TPR) repeat protein